MNYTKQKCGFLCIIFLFFSLAYSLSGQVLVADINQQNGDSNPEHLGSNGTEVVFVAYGNEAPSIYKVNSESEDVELLLDLVTYGRGDFVYHAVLIDDFYYFTTFNFDESKGYFNQLNINTGEVQEIWIGNNTFGFGSSFGQFKKMQDQIFFLNRSGNNWELISFNLNTGESKIAAQFPDGLFIKEFVVAESFAYILTDQSDNIKVLWKYDINYEGADFVLTFSNNPSTSVYGFTSYKNKLLFMALSQDNVSELWISDGSTSGTMRYLDNNMETVNRISNIEIQGDNFYSVGSNDAFELELYKGNLITGEVEILMKDILLDYDFISHVIVADDLLYLYMRKDSAVELWRTDGTDGGSFFIEEVKPATVVDFDTSVKVFEFKVLGNEFYFVAYQENSGVELWKTDGTTLGTEIVKDIYPGINNSCVEDMHGAEGHLFFVAQNPEVGREVWRSDGTAVGTDYISDIFTFNGSSIPLRFSEINDKLIFSARINCIGRELFSSNGSSIGTSLLNDINTGVGSNEGFFSYEEFGELLYFKADEPDDRKAIWATDGTVAGTAKVVDLSEALGFDSRYELSNPKGLGDDLILEAFFAEVGQCVVKYNPSQKSTEIIKVTHPTFGVNSSDDRFYKISEDFLIFIGLDPDSKIELWRTDGTESGTYMIKDIRMINESNLNLHIGNLKIHNNELYFFADDGTRSLWKTDGTESGTIRITPPGTVVNGYALNDDQIYYHTNSGFGSRVFASDGILGNEVELIFPDNLQVNFIINMNIVNDHIIISAENFNFGFELWSYDLNAQNWEVIDIVEGEDGSGVKANTFVYDGFMYFNGEDLEHGEELWRTDGTAENTSLVMDIFDGVQSSRPSTFYLWNEFIYFSAIGEFERGTELFKYSPYDNDNDGYLIPEDLDDNDPLVNVADPNDPYEKVFACSDIIISTNDAAIEFQNFTIAPNPAHNMVNIFIENEEQYDLQIIDISGRILFKKTGIKNQFLYDVLELKTGMYFISIFNPKDRSFGTQKLIVQN